MEKKDLVVLIQKYCKPYSKVCPFSSYGLKHLFEGLTGEYVTHQDFKEAMEAAGFGVCKTFLRHNYYKIKIIDEPEIPISFVTDKRGRYARFQKRNGTTKTNA